MSAGAPYEDRVLEAARRLGVATLYEASGVDCALDPGIRPVWKGAAMAGPAYTVRCRPCDNLPIHHAMAAAPAGCVLVVDCEGVLAGYWGEVLAVAAQARGLAGLVIDGGVRDIVQMEALGFAVFSRGVATHRTAKHSPGLVDVPIVIAGVPVSPGDLIVADADGVIALAPDVLDKALAGGDQRVAAEDEIMAALRAGRTTLDLFRLPVRA